MKAAYTKRARKFSTISRMQSATPSSKHVKFLEQNLHHPSLRARKYEARVDKDWRFYFQIHNDVYYIVDIIPHPQWWKWPAESSMICNSSGAVKVASQKSLRILCLALDIV